MKQKATKQQDKATTMTTTGTVQHSGESTYWHRTQCRGRNYVVVQSCAIYRRQGVCVYDSMLCIVGSIVWCTYSSAVCSAVCRTVYSFAHSSSVQYGLRSTAVYALQRRTK